MYIQIFNGKRWILMSTTQYMHYLSCFINEKAKNALISSIKKWKDIAYLDGKDYGKDNCPLCLIYSNDFLIGKRCGNCPIAIYVGKTGCFGTPYEIWESHQRKYHFPLLPRKARCGICKSIAEDEIKFLNFLKNRTRKV